MRYIWGILYGLGLLLCGVTATAQEQKSLEKQDIVPKQTESEIRSLSGHGESFEVILKFTPSEPGAEIVLTAYILDTNTNEPIRGANVTAGLSSGDKSESVVFTEIPNGLPGAYAGKARIPDDKPHSFLFDISVGDQSDLVAIDVLKAGVAGKISDMSPIENKEHIYEIKFTRTKVIIIIAVLIVLESAVILFVRRRTLKIAVKD